MVYNPDLEEETKYLKGSRLEKIFDVLTTAGYAAGGVDFYRKQAVANASSPLERGLINVAYGVPVFGLAAGMATKRGREYAAWGVENRLEVAEVRGTEGFWAGLATNVVYDPLSYTGAGAVKNVVGKVGVAGMKVLPTAARSRALLGAAKIAKVDKAIGAAKSQAISATMDPIKRTVGGATRAVGVAATEKLGKVRDIIGEAFEVGYEFRKSGPRGKEFYSDYLQMIMDRTGAQTQAFHEVRELGKPFKRFGKQAADYIESGVSTGVTGLDDYIDNVVRPYTDNKYLEAVKSGFDIGFLEDYVPHTLAPEGKKLIQKYGSEEGVIKYLTETANKTLGRERTVQSSIAQINEALGSKFFVDDLWEALAIQSQKQASDITTGAWLKQTAEKFGAEEGVEGVISTASAGAIAAKKKLKTYEGVEQSFRSYIDRIQGGGTYPIEFLSNAIETGKRSVFKGKTTEIRSLVQKISDITGEHKYFSNQIKELEKEAMGYKHSIARELTRGEGADETFIATLEKSYKKVMESGLPTQRRLLETQTRELKATVSGIQREILDPINREISSLKLKTDATKTVKDIRGRVADKTEDAIGDLRTPTRKDVNVLLPKQMADFLDDMETVAQKPDLEARFGKLYRKGHSLIKRSLTTGFGPLVHLAFLGRNIHTGIQQNIQQMGVARTMRGSLEHARLALDIGSFETLERGKVSAKEMKQMIRESGVVESMGVADVEVARTLYPTTLQKITGFAGSAMQTSESMVRKPLYLEEIKSHAAREVQQFMNDVHFNYGDEFITKFEKRLTDIVPFYKWPRKNIPRQVKQLINQPKNANMYGKIQSESIRQANMKDEYEQRSEWHRNSYLLPNPLDQKSFISMSIPMIDLTMSADSMYFSLTPYKSALEYLSVDAGWGSDEYKAQRKQQILEKFAFGRYGSTAKKLSDPSIPLMDKVMSQTGAPIVRPRPERVSLEEFDYYRYRTYEPSKEQEYAAWTAAGQPEGFKILTLGEKQGGLGVEKDRVIKPRMWEIWKKEVVIPGAKPEFDLMAISAELFERTRGYKFTDADLARLTSLSGAEQTTALEQIVGRWEDWKQARFVRESATVEQEISARERSGNPDDFVNRTYHNSEGKLLGVAVFERGEIEEIQGYLSHHVQLSSAAFEWAFIQSDMPPEEFLLKEYRKENAKYVDMQAAREELRGFDVDAPVPAEKWGMAEAMKYTAYRKGRIDHEQDLIERAMQRGETQ